MKAEVSLAKRPRSGDSGSKLRCLDLNLDGWKDNGTDNGRKPHGGYKGLPKHPLGIHSFQRGSQYQQQLQQTRRGMEEEGVRPSPPWAIRVHSLPTHSGESPLLSGRLLSASKHDSTNGRVRPEKDSPRTARSAPPHKSKKAASFYRPNSTHQYLTATELKDASDCRDVLKYGRPTRTTLLRARHRATSATSSALEARRQNEQRVAEMKKVSAFCSPEEMAPVYSDSEDQSFYSFLMGARYNRAHCLDSKSLLRHGVYMPRHNPLGCFVITDRTERDESPRSDAGPAPRPQTERQQRPRPTTAPAYGRKSSARAARTPRTPRPAWGDVTVSLHVTKGVRQVGSYPKDGSCRLGARLPVVHGTSLSKLQKFKEPPPPLEDPLGSEALQPPPSLISARGGGPPSFPPPAPNSLDHEPPLPHPLPPAPADNLGQVGRETEDDTEAEGRVLPPGPDAAAEMDPNQTDGTALRGELTDTGGGEEGEEGGIVSEEERLKEGGGGGEEREEGEEGGGRKEEEADELKEEEEEKEEEVARETEEEMAEVRKDGDNLVTTTPVPDDATAVTNDVTQQHVTDSKRDVETARENDLSATPPEPTPENSEQKDAADEEKREEENVIFFVTEQEADVTTTNETEGDVSCNAVTNGVSGGDPPEENPPPDNKFPVQEEDAISTTSSKKSLSKRVSFKIPPTIDDDENAAQSKSGSRAVDVSDSDLDDPGQGQGHGAEPLRVIVTHIEKRLGAPVSRESEAKVVAKHP